MPDEKVPVGDSESQDLDYLNDVEDGPDDEPEDSDDEESEEESEESEEDQPSEDDEDGKDEEDAETGGKKGKKPGSDAGDDDELDLDDLSEDESENLLEDVEGRVSFRDLKKAYPDIFKKVPELRHALNREREFTELFPTVEDAKIAAGGVNNLYAVEQQITQGVSVHLLASLAANKPDSFARYTDGLLPSVRKIDEKTYLRMINPVVAEQLRQVENIAKASGNKDLIISVQNVCSQLWKKREVPDVKFAELPEVKQEAPSEEAKQILQNQFAGFVEDLSSTTFRQVRRQILAEPDIKAIKDPKYREFIVDQIALGADSLMQKDPMYMAALKSFRRRISNGDMGPQTKKTVLVAYLRRVKSLIGPVRRKVLGGARSSGKLGSAAKSEPTKKFRPSSETASSAAKAASKSGKQPVLGGTIRDDVKFLSS